MGLRFRRRIKIAPGLHLNVSRSGVSTSLGGPGATVNAGGVLGARVTVGLPGSGLSYSEALSDSLQQSMELRRGRVWSAIGLILIGAVLLSCIVANA